MHEKILIIDDEPDILNLLSSVLDSEGYKVLTAADGIEGIQQFQEEHPDLIITDVKMPHKDGLGVLKEIKGTDSDVDVIVLTGHSSEATAIDCLRNGAYDYLLKPLEDIEVMLVSIERALHKRQLERKNRQLVRQLEEMSIKDPLTGLFNFRQLYLCLDDEIARSKRYGHSFCGIMIDIDCFKEVNETYGHLFGDYVLQKLGEIMRQYLRSTDRLFRYGEDQFFIIMPETGKEEVGIAADRLMAAIRSHDFICDDHQTKITISIGCALYPDQAKDKIEVVMFADQALSQAKERGRDRMMFSI